MAGFVVDTDSLIEVANALGTLRHVLGSIATDEVTPAEIGGVVLAQQVGAFNTQWKASAGVISGEVQTLQDALFTAAAHYERTEQLVSRQSHDRPTGSRTATGGHHHPGAHAPHAHRHAQHVEHHHHHHAEHHHSKDTGTGTTTIGPRFAGTGTTVIGGPPRHHHTDHAKGTGSGTTTIGPGGVSTTVHTGPGRGYGTTTIGGDQDVLQESDGGPSETSLTER